MAKDRLWPDISNDATHELWREIWREIGERGRHSCVMSLKGDDVKNMLTIEAN